MSNTGRWGRGFAFALLVILGALPTLTIAISSHVGTGTRRGAESNVLVSALPTPTPTVTAPPVLVSGESLTLLEADLIRRLNAGRAAAGLPPWLLMKT